MSDDLIRVHITDEMDRTVLPGWSQWTAEQPAQAHGIAPDCADFHSIGLTENRIEGMGIVGNKFYAPHVHTIHEDWPVERKNAVARHLMDKHPRKGKSCRSCGAFVLVGAEHFCPRID